MMNCLVMGKINWKLEVSIGNIINNINHCEIKTILLVLWRCCTQPS